MNVSIRKFSPGLLWTVGLVIVGVVALATRQLWLIPTQNWVRNIVSGQRAESAMDGHDHGAGDEHDDHADHDHAGHDDEASLELSPQGMRNIGLGPDSLRPLQLDTFRRSITVPGIIVERPGRTQVQVSTPMAGVVTHVHAVQGEAVQPGSLLFQLRVTAEELVSTQTDLLKTIGELDVENREIARLSEATSTGAIPQKTVLERQYAKEKLQALLNVQREALRLHGLSDGQIHDIEQNRRLLRELQIMAPHRDRHGSDELRLTGQVSHAVGGNLEPERITQAASTNEQPAQNAVDLDSSAAPLVLQEVQIHKGQAVVEGQTLCVLADYSELYIEGQAFEQDLDLLMGAAQRQWKVSATLEMAGGKQQTVPNLELVYSGSTIHADSRTLPFYVRLPNEIIRDIVTPQDQRFIDWRFRPGQRVQVQVPVEEWADQLVVPVEAVAREGAEWFVFQQNGSHFDRVAVHIKYRDANQAVIANDGSVFPGDVIALRGAHQLQMALKNKSGGGVDPHAGHNH